jgi:hypothetical protein
MKYVYIVEQGDYSDYHVVGIFSTKELATAEAERLNTKGEYSVAEVRRRVLDPGVVHRNEGLEVFHVSMGYNGSDVQVRPAKYDTEEPKLVVWKKTEALAYDHKSIGDGVQGCVWAKCPEHVIKIANEFRVQQIALGNMNYREGAAQ